MCQNQHGEQDASASAARLAALVTDEGCDAFNTLYERYLPLVRSMAHRYDDPNGAFSRAELEQECVIALYRAALHYNETRNVTFGLYARICMQNALCSLHRQKPPVPSDIPVGLAPDDSDPANAIQESDLMQFVTEQLKRELNAEELRVFCLYLDGYSYEKIAGKTGLDRKRVDNILYRTKNKLKRIAAAYGIS